MDVSLGLDAPAYGRTFGSGALPKMKPLEQAMV